MSCLHDHSCEDHNCSADWSLHTHIDLSKVSALNEAVAGSVKSVFKPWNRRLDTSEVGIAFLSLEFSFPPPLGCPAATSVHVSLKDVVLACCFVLLVKDVGSGLLESNDGDPELLVFIPFSGTLKETMMHLYPRNNLRDGLLESNDGDPELLVFIPFTSDVKIKSISVVGGSGGTSPSKMRAFINRDGIDFSDAQNMQPVQEWDLNENLQGLLEYQTRYSRFQGVGNLTLHFPDNFDGDTTQIYYIGLKGEATQLKRDVVATIVYEITPNPSDHKTRADAGSLSHVE
ncbi:hypothetical protein C4D60_Mb01t05860 [Musa balbisiana]|uniref:PITH domain-containing protein n=1 Tax=Musa balbisiana TaxID=52838 RepID=A0A4V4H754_MUSBA|nr:hypothetical protein C4D60_Mb01t05860 [Musa balbisiana]